MKWRFRKGRGSADGSWSVRGSAAGSPSQGSHKGSQAVSEAGTVTAEFAVTLPAVLVLLALLLAGSAAGITQLRLEEAARAGARSLARGDATSSVEGIVRRLAGEAASTIIRGDGEWMNVTVSTRLAGPLGSMIPWRLSATAWVRGETPRSSAANLPFLQAGQGPIDFNGYFPDGRLKALVEEGAA
ncbi:TadE family type IV pilus minor pilin [bacterium RCC_150]